MELKNKHNNSKCINKMIFDKYTNKSSQFYKYIFTCASILFLCSCQNNDKLNVYECSSYFDAYSCDKKCVLDKDVKYSFLVSQESKAVSQIVYSEGAMTGSITHEECIIFNNKNWDCSKNQELPYTLINTKMKMVNGIYTYKKEILDKQKYEIKNPEEKETCAKLD